MIDYSKIGFRCGIEVHNRLATTTKLFCNCSPRFSNQKSYLVVARKLRAVAGELGQIDQAALYEYLRDRTFFYQVFKDTTCLVELDEEPPHELNKEALSVALQVARLLHCEIPHEIHVMRKTVVDGSNTCGFQRTAIIGLNGWIATTKGKVRISSVALEEESAGIVEQKGNEIVYRLDRLGIPLVEVGTETDIKNPEQAKEVAERIGLIIRSTKKSQRGIGVTRQDVNVSVENGARIEIKGVQELDMIPRIIDNEVERQLKNKGKIKKETRVAKEDGTTEFLRPLPGGERMYPETDVIPIAITKQMLSEELPETWEEKEKRFSKILPKDLVPQILRSEYLDWFEQHYKICEPVIVATTYTSTLKDLRRKGVHIENINSAQLEYVFNLVADKKVSKEAIPELLEFVASNPGVKETDILKVKKSITEAELRKIIKNVIFKNPELVKQMKTSALMGDIMKVVRGRIDGKIVSKILKEMLEEKE